MNVLSFSPPMPSADPTVGELIRLYLSLEAKVETRRAVRAWEERERVLNRFVAAFGQQRISECAKGHLKIWIEANHRLKSDWTRGRWCRTVQRVFNWAMDDMDLIARNPFKGVHYRKGKRGRPLTDDEFEALMRLSGPVFQPVLRFCRLTGARPDEMSAAKWTDLHLDEASGAAWIMLVEHKTSDYDDAPPRIIALPKAAVELLASIRRSLGTFPGMEPEHIFRNARGRPWTRNAIGLRMRKLRDKAKLPPDAKLYGCRHAFATAAVENDVSLKDLSQLLGHTSTRMSEHYVHIAGKHLRQCEKAEQAAGGAPAPVVPQPVQPPESWPF